MEERTDAQYVSGHFVKEFLLFYGEKMEYYLTFTNRQGEGKQR